MRTAAVIGPRGFIGSSIAACLAASGLRVIPIERRVEAAAEPALSCDIAFFCAGNSAPLVSARDPLRCLQASVSDLYGYLTRLKARRWVVMSSVSVYPESLAVKSEDAPIDLQQLSTYGAHKALAESYVRSFAADAVVLRVAYLYGAGLKRNLLFDLRQGATQHFLTAGSVLAPLDVTLLAQATLALADRAPAGTYNVASRHLLAASEITALRGGEHSFRGERHIDERGLALSKLERYWQQPQTAGEHRASIAAFVKGG